MKMRKVSLLSFICNRSRPARLGLEKDDIRYNDEETIFRASLMLAATRETRNLIGLRQRPSNSRYKHERENGV